LRREEEREREGKIRKGWSNPQGFASLRPPMGCACAPHDSMLTWGTTLPARLATWTRSEAPRAT
jgi:hypothetical protein